MARSPIFLFMIILVISVSFVMMVAAMRTNTPIDGQYLNSSSQINQSQVYISRTVEQAPSWVVPAVFVTLALTLIATLFLFKRV
jgi:hypothetical protein